MKLNDKQKILGIFGILSLVLIAVGVSVAFFTYSKDGITENTIKSGSITFLYDEINQSGNSIGITDALPISDTQGKAQTNYFNFKIVSNSSNTNTIPYEITLRQKQGTDNIGNKVKVYLSKIDSYNSAVNTEEEITTSLFSSLQTVTHNNYSEKLLHTDIVPASDQRYEQYYRLKMWLDESATISSTEETFTVTVNVYANGHVLDASSSNNEITSLSVGGTPLTVKSTENDIDYYEATLPEGTEQTTITVETSDYTRTKITKTQSDYTTPIAISNNITKLSNTLNKTVSLTDGANYFKIITISEDNTEKETHMKISVEKSINIFGQSYRVISGSPTLTTTSEIAGENGLYSMEVTNGFGGTDGTTYYFRGNVENNYVSFAEKLWRIIRINEDGTIRIILDEGINSNQKYKTPNNVYSYMYYSNSDIKANVENWYNTNITGTNATKVATGNYFCEAAKVKHSSTDTSGNTTMSAFNNYTIDLACNTDGNSKGLLDNSVGLINYDEVVLAGGYPHENNNNYYLYKNYKWWTMSPAGVSSGARVWVIYNDGFLNNTLVTSSTSDVRPVINLKANVTATGTGTSADPYVIQ